MQKKLTRKNAFFMPSSLKVPQKLTFSTPPCKIKPDFAVSEVVLPNQLYSHPA